MDGRWRDARSRRERTTALPHDTPLITTIVAGLGLAFLFALAARKLKLPTIAGYLVAGVAVGPFTPGYVADQGLANELAEIGVILLMFGVGLHFSLKDLLAVRAIAIPGALGQIVVATLLGMGLAWGLGWSPGAGFVFGLALSVASTVVLLRALQERRLVETEKGRIAVGWLIVEDLAMVLALVLLPPLAGALGGQTPPGPAHAGPAAMLVAPLGLGAVGGTLALTALKVAAFLALMLVVGRRLIPWLLHVVAHLGSRELFRLAVLAIALGVAWGSAQMFGVSFALGAFFAGMVMAESPLSHQAATDTLPLRDAFAVLFFVSVGMLFDPSVLLNSPLALLATVAIIVIGKSAAAFLIVRAFGHPRAVGLTIAASLAQIGEFSFILVVMGASLKILPDLARDLVVAGALISILLNPLLFVALDRLTRRPEAGPVEAPVEAAALAPTALRGHAIIIGCGRVGARVRDGLKAAGTPFLVIEENSDLAARLRGDGVEAYAGAAGAPGILTAAEPGKARWLVLAIPDAHEAGPLIEAARAANPALRIIARAHGDDAVAHLRKLGADIVLMGEEEIARGMLARILAPEPEPPPAVAPATPAA